MKQRILMIADSDGQWTKRYIEHLLLPQGYEVVLFPIWGDHGKFMDFYRESGVTVYEDKHTLPFVRHIPKLRMWVRIACNAAALSKLGPFHVIHNHYLSRRDLALGKAIRKRFSTAKWIASFWGSDLLRGNPRHRAQMKPYLKDCDAITIHSALQFDVIEQFYGKAAREKTALVYFGQTVYQDIDRVRKMAAQAECKSHFGIDPARKVLCIGYNASPAQHQINILNALETLPEETLKNLTLILQMTYGSGGEAYLSAVKEAAHALPSETLILTEFMDGTQSAYLRLAADAFILAIETDSFSASLQEYLYAGAKVMTAAWLSYPQLQALSIETTPFDSYEEIPALLDPLLNAPLSPEQSLCRSKLPSHYSWDAVKDAWLKLYT